MKLKPPSKDSLTWHALYQGVTTPEAPEEHQPAAPKAIIRPLGSGIVTDAAFEGVEVGIAFRGAAEVDEYNFERSALQLAEAQRLAELKLEGYPGTPDHDRGQAALLGKVFERICPEVRNTKTGEHVTGDDAQEFLRGLDLLERFRLLYVALGHQSLSRRQLLLDAGSGGSEARGSDNAANG